MFSMKAEVLNGELVISLTSLDEEGRESIVESVYVDREMLTKVLETEKKEVNG